ncbi:sigma-70 family RNA polymerase sigma factor [Streptomyces abikoensis]|uniref:sigma-70 family RNA polymerase sigma factor n=1 Tax=Streptomyces abikoensis TaxID=97398 RepID=UPI00167194CA|nr:sigma-70 family RNA polymerase sigma factor [Streptomyces abikoensis]GGP55615.1 hypothetical protein GCM10010214_31010 [Streptomyces abikoensis]
MNDLEVRHGYTLIDLHRFAASAVAADRSLASNAHLRYDIAWSAIAEALIEAGEPPSPQELVRVGWQAIYADVKQGWQLYGVARSSGERAVGSAPRFVTYWRHTHETPVEERLVERIAVWEVLGSLPPVYRDAVVALAAHGTLQGAAQALGITEAAMKGRIATAKRRFAARWYAPEAPPRLRIDRRVGSYATALVTHCAHGHEYTPENTRWDRNPGRRGKVRRCRACERIRSADRRARRLTALATDAA